MFSGRSSGILMHITSLPGSFGSGDLGPEAFRFADFLEAAGQSVWQILPIVPVGFGYSPYASPSTFAGNADFISPELLIDYGLLSSADLADGPDFPVENIDFERTIPYKKKLLRTAYVAFKSDSGREDRADLQTFCDRHESWLDEYALFEALKAAHDGLEWTDWKRGIAALRDPDALRRAHDTYAGEIRMVQFWQFLFDRQWSALKAYCNAKQIRILGDLPIYVAQDSADVWANPHLFCLDETGKATVVSGVPPDYFSETGQRWGNPIYRWDLMRESGYAWWTKRFARILELVDLVRLDHFKGFEAYWEISASEDTAINGRWVTGPGADLFDALTEKLGDLPVIAENLGVITDGVTDLMRRFGFPGMAILQFAFDDGPGNEFLPHNFAPDLVAYTGTHDNDTFLGWWTNTVSTQDVEKAKSYCRSYLDMRGCDDSEMPWAGIRALMASVARMAVTPMQDVLGLGTEGRMNTPGTVGGKNWGWRMDGSCSKRNGSNAFEN